MKKEIGLALLCMLLLFNVWSKGNGDAGSDRKVPMATFLGGNEAVSEVVEELKNAGLSNTDVFQNRVLDYAATAGRNAGLEDLHLNRYPCCTYPAASKAAESQSKELRLALSIRKCAEDLSEAVVHIERRLISDLGVYQAAIQFRRNGICAAVHFGSEIPHNLAIKVDRGNPLHIAAVGHLISSSLSERTQIIMIMMSISALAYMFEYLRMILGRPPHMSFRKSIMRISLFVTPNGRWWTSMRI